MSKKKRAWSAGVTRDEIQPPPGEKRFMPTVFARRDSPEAPPTSAYITPAAALSEFWIMRSSVSRAASLTVPWARR